MSAISIQPAVTANGETVLAVYTPMGAYLCTLGPDFVCKIIEKSQMGSRIFGIGPVHFESSSGNKVLNDDTTRNLHIYFYNSNGEDAVKFNGKLPSFMNEKCEVTQADITAIVSNKTDVSQLTSVKEGVMKERIGTLNICGSFCGVTAYWPQGYGTGEFDSMCVSLVNLETLRDDSTKEQWPIYTGICLSKATSRFSTEDLSYIRNGVNGITDENSFLLKIKGMTGLLNYNLLTGDLTQSESTYSGYMGVWGMPQYIIDGVLYGLTSKETTTQTVTSLNQYVFSYNISSGNVAIGSSAVMTYQNEISTFLRVGSDLYVQGTTSYNGTSTSSQYNPKTKYYKINLTNLNATSTALSLETVPAYMYGAWKISSFDEPNIYLLHDTRNKISYKFTDISNIENSITEPYFINCAAPFTVAGKTLFMCQEKKGFYNSAPVKSTILFKNTNYEDFKNMLIEGDTGPLISYAHFSKTYEKPEDADFTTNYYITVTANNASV